MANSSTNFLTATTYDQIETATDSLIARTTNEVRISEDIVDKGYMSSLAMAIMLELEQPKLSKDEAMQRQQVVCIIKKQPQQVLYQKQDDFYAIRIKDTFLTVTNNEELKDANERLATGDITGYKVPIDKSSFEEMDRMTMGLALKVDSLNLSQTETHFVVRTPT